MHKGGEGRDQKSEIKEENQNKGQGGKKGEK